MIDRVLGVSGDVKLHVIRGGGADGVEREVERVTPLSEMLREGLPSKKAPQVVNDWRARNIKNLWRGARRVIVARAMGIPHFYGSLHGVLITPDDEIELGLMSLRVVTTAGVDKLVAAMNATDATTIQNFKFHGFGTGTTGDLAADTALQTELTTQYATDNTRITGSQGVGASNNIYRTTATLAPDSGSNPLNISEHGVFSAATAGTLLDRSVFTAVPLVPGSDSLAVTYDLTFNAGG